MKQWVTEFWAIDPRDGQLKKWCGPHVEGLTMATAQQWCYDNAGHLVVVGELISEIPCKPGTYEPDWTKKVDYDTPQLN